MKKYIIIGVLLIAVILIAQGRLHKIDKNTKITGWLQIRGDFWPIWGDKYDLGKRKWWWDSSFVGDIETHSILIWSADSTDTLELTPTFSSVMSGDDIEDSLNNAPRNITNSWMWEIDTIFFTDGGADTSSIVQTGSFLEFASDNIINFVTSTRFHNGRYTTAESYFGVLADTMYKLATAPLRWKEVWALCHMWTDGTKADTGKIYDDGSKTIIETDNTAKFTSALEIIGSLNPYNGIAGYGDARAITWEGTRWYLDFDSDDSLAFIAFDYLEGDTLKSDTITHILEWTGAGGFKSNKATFSHTADDGLDTTLLIQWADTNATVANRPGMVINMDTTDASPANTKVTGLKFAGTAFSNTADYYLYINSTNYINSGNQWFMSNAYCSGNFGFTGDALHYISSSYSRDFLFNWNNTMKGDIIFRDGNLGVANPDFLQIQDSSGAIVAQISNTGDITSFGDSINFITDACSTYWHQTADSSIIESNKPLKIKAPSVIIGEDGTAQFDSMRVGGGDVVIKMVKIGSHFAFILSGSDTLWAAADTTNF